MRLATVYLGNEEKAGIVTGREMMAHCGGQRRQRYRVEGGNVRADLRAADSGADRLVQPRRKGGTGADARFHPRRPGKYGPLYRNPRRIFGIGLNYVDHAGDIGSAAPVGISGELL